jgi:hypothetical protein
VNNLALILVGGDEMWHWYQLPTRGITSYGLSPNHQRYFSREILKKDAKKGIAAVKCLWPLAAMILVTPYYLTKWMDHEHHQSMRKQPGQFDHEE